VKLLASKEFVVLTKAWSSEFPHEAWSFDLLKTTSSAIHNLIPSQSLSKALNYHDKLLAQRFKTVDNFN
jgi:hypothetical protein